MKRVINGRRAIANETIEQYIDRQIEAFQDEELFLPLNIDYEKKIFHMMCSHPELSRLNSLQIYLKGLEVAKEAIGL